MNPPSAEDLGRTELVTPLLPHHHGTTTNSTPTVRPIISNQRRPRIRICKPVQTTPVTWPIRLTPSNEVTPLLSNSDFLESRRDVANASTILEPGQGVTNTPIRRRLNFAIAQTPKRACVGRPTFRIYGNKERTQPTNTRTRLAGPLETRLTSSCAAAAAACVAFRALLTGSTFNPVFFDRALLLDVVQRTNNLYIGRPIDAGPNALLIAVLAPRPLRVDDRLTEQLPGQTQYHSSDSYVVFVPQPWYAAQTDSLRHFDVEWLVTPFKFSIVEKDRIPVLPPQLQQDRALTSMKSNSSGTNKVNSTQTASDQNQMLIWNNSSISSIYTRFSNISPHLTTVSISVEVIVSLSQAQLVMVEDSVKETAILLSKSKESSPNVGFHTFENVTILSERVSAQSILQFISTNFETCATAGLKLASLENLTLLVLALPE